MSKERREQLISAAEERNHLAELEEWEIKSLADEVSALQKNGQEVADLQKNIGLILVDVSSARRYINDESRFVKVMKRINNRKQEVRNVLMKTKAVKTNVAKTETEPGAEKFAFKKWEEREYSEPYEEDEQIEKLVAALGLGEEEPEAKKPSGELKTSAAAPVISGEIENKEVFSSAPKSEPDSAQVPSAAPVAISGEIINQEVLPSEAKKSWWERFKERGQKITKAIFNRETGKMAGKVGYDTVTSVLGIKLATDAVDWAARGKGDLAQWWQGRKEAKDSQSAIAEAYQRLLESFEKVKENKVLDESEKIEKRLEEFKAQVELAKITPEAKKALLDRLWAITIKHEADLKQAKKDKDEEVRRLLDAYVQAKVSGLKIAKDALNFVLTAAGLSLLRGVVYAGVSTLERAGKARHKYAKETLGGGSKAKKELFVAKDVLINSALETARALSGRGEKKGAGIKTKIIDFIKALGTVARGFGIYGVAFSDSDSAQQSVDKFIQQIKEKGVLGTAYDNLTRNAERVYDLYSHPTQLFKGHKEPAALRPEEHQEMPPTSEHIVAAPAAPAGAIEHLEQKSEAIPSLPETHRVDVVTLDDSEGVLHGGNKLMRLHPELFTHANGQPWTADEIHKWRVDELKEMGFKFKGDKWGYPMTVHGGAQVELFTDASGQPHFKLASDEHVTWHKKYKWVDTEPEINEQPVSPPNAKPTPAPEEKVDLPVTARAKSDVAAKPAMEVKTAVVPDRVKLAAAEAAVSLPPEKEISVSQFLHEHGSNPREFMNQYDNMIDATIEKLNSSMIFRGNSEKFLQAKIDALYNGKNGITFANLSSPNLTDSDSLKIIAKVWDAEEKFKFHQSDWLRDFRLALFDKSDKAMGLALAPDRDVLLRPIMTNGGHAARIWDPTEGKDIFIYDKDRIFNTGAEGKLVMEDEHGKTRVFNHDEAVELAQKQWEDLNKRKDLFRQ